MAVVTSIFVSGVSQEFRSARIAIDNQLRTPDILVVTQEFFPSDFRTIKQVLFERIKQCDAVIHLVGFAYGAEPKENWPSGKRCSYTQLEYMVARKLNKHVYVCIAQDPAQLDSQPDEPVDRRALQSRHRQRVTDTDHRYDEFHTFDELLEKVSRIDWPKPSGLAAADCCNLPFDSIGPLLKGRDDALAILRQRLDPSSAPATGAAKQILVGLGGAGKTRLALEYAWRNRDRYRALLFVSADSPSTTQPWRCCSRTRTVWRRPSR